MQLAPVVIRSNRVIEPLHVPGGPIARKVDSNQDANLIGDVVLGWKRYRSIEERGDVSGKNSSEPITLGFVLT